MLMEWAKSKLPGTVFWIAPAVTKPQILWALPHNWPDWRCQKVKLSRILSSGLKICAVASRKQENTYLSLALLNPVIPNGLPLQYEHFILQEFLYPSRVYTEPRKRLLNCSIIKKRLEQSASHVAMHSKSFSGVTRNNESHKEGNRKVTCNICLLLGHIAKDCRKKEGASCNIYKQNGFRIERTKKEQ